MNRPINNRKHAARKERLEQKIEGGLVSEHYPKVASIVINMTYNQSELLNSLPRIVNFFPDSHAYFKVDCLSKKCIDGGFDLKRVITSMIKKRKKTIKGELSCESKVPSPGHSLIDYKITVEYSK